jgi:uncharacterized Ntn-hydrolase superfamily protein
MRHLVKLILATALAFPRASYAQVPFEWRDSLVFHTFSIAAIDPRTGEVGVAVTTRVPCVGGGVPWVRKGVGAVATQANTRTEYGNELLDALARDEAPSDALKRLLAADSGSASRQIGVIDLKGRSAQHTGTGPQQWAGHRAGKNYVTQGNVLVGPQVLEAVAKTFEASEGQPRHLADRLIEAIAAGHVLGGDQRHGLRQSAAVIVADSRPGRSRRPDGVTANISVCENAEPVAELRRIYDAVSRRWVTERCSSSAAATSGNSRSCCTPSAFIARLSRLLNSDRRVRTTTRPMPWRQVDAFRASDKLSGPSVGSPSGLVDAETVAHLWAALERAGKARAVRELILESTMVRR